MADLVAFIILMAAVYTLIGYLFAWIIRFLHSNGEIRTRKWEARWLLLCIVWPILPIAVVLWVLWEVTYWAWDSLANLIHDARLGKKD